MNVLNVHEREIDGTRAEVGSLIDSLASENDRLWPWEMWPRMKFDRPLAISANGGHGPIRYYIEDYKPGRLIKFGFITPGGFNGYHEFEVLEGPNNRVILRHYLEMLTKGAAIVSWPLIIRPLHDALIEDSLAKAQAALGQLPQVYLWSPWVKILRFLMAGGKSQSQVVPETLVMAAPKSDSS